jgi:hypothetical protein
LNCEGPRLRGVPWKLARAKMRRGGMFLKCGQ